MVGTQCGDEALREIAHSLFQALRPYDLCVRFAGDEFVIVLGDCSREAAKLKRRELQERIEQIALTAGAGCRVGVSAGAAVYPHDGHSADLLLSCADRRMYSDKESRKGSLAPLLSRSN